MIHTGSVLTKHIPTLLMHARPSPCLGHARSIKDDTLSCLRAFIPHPHVCSCTYVCIYVCMCRPLFFYVVMELLALICHVALLATGFSMREIDGISYYTFRVGRPKLVAAIRCRYV